MLKSCTKGYQGADAIRIALVGDSHAARLLVALAPYLDAMKWRITTYMGWGCSWQDPPRDDCREAMGEIDKELLASRYNLVLTTALRGAQTTPAEYAKAWAPIVANGSQLVVLADNPTVNEESLTCLTRINMSGDRDRTAECGTTRTEALALPDSLIAASHRVSNTTLVDLTQYFCTTDRCPSVIGDVIVYEDTTHITATYMRTLGPAIVDALQQVLSRK